jgi:hypothetical protein
MGNAYSIIQTARSQGLNPLEIDTKFVTLGRTGERWTGARITAGSSPTT